MERGESNFFLEGLLGIVEGESEGEVADMVILRKDGVQFGLGNFPNGGQRGSFDREFDSLRQLRGLWIF